MIVSCQSNGGDNHSKAYINVIPGNNIALRVGNLEMSEDKIFKNIIMGLKNALEKIPGGWKAVHSLSLNSRNSASLPSMSYS
jgi:ribosomal protein L1